MNLLNHTFVVYYSPISIAVLYVKLCQKKKKKKKNEMLEVTYS